MSRIVCKFKLWRSIEFYKAVGLKKNVKMLIDIKKQKLTFIFEKYFTIKNIDLSLHNFSNKECGCGEIGRHARLRI